MKKLVILLFAMCISNLWGENLVFNGDFELGTHGFAVERRVRPDTNPKLKFLTLKSEVIEKTSGQRALKVLNPYGEECCLISREFLLEPNTEYRISLDLKHTGTGTVPFTSGVSTIYNHQDWHSLSHEFKVGTQWQNYSFTTKTKERKRHYYFSSRLPWISTDLLIDNLKVEPVQNNAVCKTLDITVSSERKWYVSESKSDPVVLTFRAFNRSTKRIKREIPIAGIDDYTQKVIYRKRFAIDLRPGESCAIPFTETLGRYGCVRIGPEKPNVNWNVLDGFYTVFGKYVPRPVDLNKDFVVSITGGVYYHSRPKFKYDSYRCFNTSLDEMLEIYQNMGLRLIRDMGCGRPISSWFLLEPKEGRFDFSHMDRVMKMYEKNHIECFPVLNNFFVIKKLWWRAQYWPEFMKKRLIHIENDPPNVLKNLRGFVYYPPMEDWQRYVSAVANHLRGKVQAYEIINEACFFFSPEIYLDLLKSAAESIRAEDPQATIVGFCVSGDFGEKWDDWLSQCLKLGGLQYADDISIHPYSSKQLGSQQPADQQIRNLFSLAGKYAAGKKFGCWNSELFYLYDTSSSKDFLDHQKAFQAATRFLVDLGEGLKQSISINGDQLWKKVLTPSSGVGVSWHELIPNETAVAYNALARYFEGSKPVAKYRLENGTICYVYRRKDQSLIAAIWNYKERDNTLADLADFELMDLFGNPVQPGTIAIRQDPYYVFQGRHGEKEFLKSLENLNIELSDPFRSSPLVRIIHGNVIGSLMNDSSRDLPLVLKFTGVGCSSLAQAANVPAHAEFQFSLPLHEPFAGSSGRLDLKFAGKTQSIPVNVIPVSRWGSGEKQVFSSPDNKLRCSGTAVLANGLCELALEIHDLSDSGPLGDRMPWETDCVELFFDLAPTKIPLEDPQFYTPETFRIFIMPRNEKQDQFRIQGTAVAANNIDCTTKLLKHGYRITLSFPVKKRKCIGFDIKVDDSGMSGTAPRREAEWGGGDSLFRNRCNFGVLDSGSED
jgi:hypothetical protein